MGRRPRLALRPLTGMGTAATAMLALLTAGVLLLALGAPKIALSARTSALRSLLATSSPLAQCLQVTASWDAIEQGLAGGGGGIPTAGHDLLTDDQLSGVTSQLRDDFTIGPLRPASQGAAGAGSESGTGTASGTGHPQSPASLGPAWAGLTSEELNVAGSFRTLDGAAALTELLYRSPLASYTTLVAGRYPGQVPLPAASAPGESPSRNLTLEVAVTVQTAARFGLRPGSVFRLLAPNLGVTAALDITVTGIIKPRLSQSAFWLIDPTAVQPAKVVPPGNNPIYWIGAAFVSQAEAPNLERLLGSRLNATWVVPLDLSAVQGDQAQSLYDTLNQVTTQSPALPGNLATATPAFQVSTGLLQPLGDFLATEASVGTLQSLLFVSLDLAGLVVLLLACHMVTLRRATELAMLRARGASLRQVAWTAMRGALIACVPAAVITAGVVLITPGPTPSAPSTWWPAVAAVLVAVCGPAVAGAWPQRLPRRRRGRRSPGARRGIRLVAEITACALAIAALVVLREQGTSTADLFTSAVPALVAVPVVIIEQRLYPLMLRTARRIAARRRGAAGFLALSTATRSPLSPALPMFALVLVLTVAAFGGMTRAAITGGEVAASWRAVGADVSIEPGAVQGSGASALQAVTGNIPPDAVRAIAAVPGVRHVAAIYQDLWSLPGGQQVTGIAVDPASYAALVASETGYWPPVPAAGLQEHEPAGVTPILATPDVAAQLRSTTSTLTSDASQPVRPRVAGVLSGTPALPGTGSFIVLPISELRPISDPIEPNVLLITGPDIDRARLSAVLAKWLPGASATDRLQVLAALTGAPLQHGTFDLFALAVGAAAALGLAVLLLALALGAAGRELTLARLATMGLTARQRAWLVALEVGPAVLAAAIAGAVCALLLPAELGPVLDLSAFTGSAVPVPFGADPVSVALPLAGLAVLACVALAIEMRAGRRLGVATAMRAESSHI
jgi:putative ABC transport system permease protein